VLINDLASNLKLPHAGGVNISLFCWDILGRERRNLKGPFNVKQKEIPLKTDDFSYQEFLETVAFPQSGHY